MNTIKTILLRNLSAFLTGNRTEQFIMFAGIVGSLELLLGFILLPSSLPTGFLVIAAGATWVIAAQVTLFLAQGRLLCQINN